MASPVALLTSGTLESLNPQTLNLSSLLRTDTMRDVFDDLVLDGITPDRSTFHTILGANMRARCLEDVLYYYDRMMMQGLIPDSTLFHIILRACARARQIDKAFEVAEEMEAVGTPHTAKTYQHLLNVCAKAGHIAKA
jgi:pentatricopeptide repeat protein